MRYEDETSLPGMVPAVRKAITHLNMLPACSRCPVGTSGVDRTSCHENGRPAKYKGSSVPCPEKKAPLHNQKEDMRWPSAPARQVLLRSFQAHCDFCISQEANMDV
jgi:hypothetical protein